MQVVLVMCRADGDRRNFSITRSVTVVGRREDCDFRIPLGDISRKHCRLIKDDGTLRIEDMGSSNGTYCNGQRIHDTELQPGDTVQIGPVIFVVQIDGSPAEEDIRPYQPEEPSESSVAEHDGQTIAAGKEPVSDGEFDPMSILEDSNIDSSILPALGDSALNDDTPMNLAENNLDSDG